MGLPIAIAPEVDRPEMGYDFSDLSALVVDDLYLDRNILVLMLEALGIGKVVEAGDGSEALDILTLAQPDVIFTDHRMTPMSGLDLIQRIRAGESAADRFIPIVIVSSYTELGDVIRTRDFGATEFLAKPISAELVYQRLCTLIENPRSFVDTDRYFGPDRRRREQATPGDDRRRSPHQYSPPRNRQRD